MPEPGATHGGPADAIAARTEPLAARPRPPARHGRKALPALVALAWTAASAALAQPTPRLGQPLAEAEAARLDRTVFPDGRGLPPGRGSAVEGAALYRARCASCHGPRGEGATAEELAGGQEPLTSRTPDKTIGLYWPYATTLFDFIRRAMPMDAPGSLSDDETYALTAWLLHANGLVGEREEMNARSLPRLRMPNREGFIAIDAPSGTKDGARR